MFIPKKITKKSKLICALLIIACIFVSMLPSAFALEAASFDINHIDMKQFYVSEKDITISVELSSDTALDSRAKLNISMKDTSDGSVVAEQASCRYYGRSSLLYTLRVPDDCTLSSDKSYILDFAYSGDYEFVNENYKERTFSPSGREEIIRYELINRDTMRLAFYTANFDEAAEYYISYDGERYEAESAENGWITVTLGEEYSVENSDYGSTYYYVGLYEKDSDSYQYISSYSFYIERLGYGGFSDEDDYRISTMYRALPVLADSFFVSIYKNDSSDSYTQADMENIHIYLVDAATLETVGEAETPELTQWGSVSAHIQISSAPEDGKRYLIVADDGYTSRVRSIYASDKFGYNGCGLNVEGNNYNSESITNAQKLKYQLWSVYNFTDPSKLNIVIRDNDDNTVAELDTTSIKQDEYNNVLFTMNRTVNKISSSESYIMLIYYDGKLAGTERLRYYEAGSKLYVHGVYQTDSETYIPVNKYELENASSNPFTYTLVNSENGEEMAGSLYRTAGNYYIIKFDETPDEDALLNGVRLKAENSEATLYSNNIWEDDVATVSMPFLYNIAGEESDTAYIYGEGIDPEKEYKLCGVYNIITGEEASIEFTASEGMLTAPLDSFKDVQPDEDDGYVTFEENGIAIGAVSEYYFSWGSYSDAFYSQFKNQNHRIAVLKLPFDAYAEYKTADTEAGLDDAEYAPIRESVTYTLSEGEGEKTIYAKFRTADKTESDVMTATVNYDITPPAISVDDMSDTYSVDRDGDLHIPYKLTSSEKGRIYYECYSENNILIDDGYSSISKGENDGSFYLWGGNGTDWTKAVKLVCYAKDAAENKSEEYSFDIEVINPYYTQEIPGGTILFDTSTGTVLEINTELSWVSIPHTINGVTVTAIDYYAIDYDSTIEKLRIPETVTNIDGSWRLSNKTLQVKENSYAHTFAQEHSIDFEIVTTEAGDVNDDGFVNSDDAIYLLKYLEEPLKYPLAVSGDIDGSGEVDSKDAVAILNNASYDAAENTDMLSLFINSKTVYEEDKISLLISGGSASIKTLKIYDIENDSGITFDGAAIVASDAAVSDYDSENKKAVIAFERNTECGDVIRLNFTAGSKTETPQVISCKAVATVVENGIEKQIDVTVTNGEITITEKPVIVVTGISFADKNGYTITKFAEASNDTITVKADYSDETLAEEADINLYFAQYDSEGVLVNIECEKNVTGADEYSITPAAGASSMRVFMWDGNYRPIIASSDLR